MPSRRTSLDVYSAAEVARAAGVPIRAVEEAIAAGRVRTVHQRFLASDVAAPLVAELQAEFLREQAIAPPPDLFEASRHARRETRIPIAASTTLHGTLIAAVALWPLLGSASTTEMPVDTRPDVRLVFLATPGPGGGGGGGGLRLPKPPARVARKGDANLSSPVPRPAPPPEPEPPRAEPPPPDPEPPVVAPVASRPAEPETRAGVLDAPKVEESAGPGAGGGAGTGQGGGIGEGQGAGIGPGTGGGTGGGPYRPGSGIEPPSILREVKPEYSEEARRRGIEGDVIVEIVVRRDGSVGDVRIMRGLGHGLDERAARAVGQWRFSPARRHGTPVDVLVEVAVEFKLR
jgi:TonB family protein